MYLNFFLAKFDKKKILWTWFCYVVKSWKILQIKMNQLNSSYDLAMFDMILYMYFLSYLTIIHFKAFPTHSMEKSTWNFNFLAYLGFKHLFSHYVIAVIFFGRPTCSPFQGLQKYAPSAYWDSPLVAYGAVFCSGFWNPLKSFLNVSEH